MASESESSAERNWLVEPPASTHIAFRIAAGDQVEVTPEIRQAFENLVVSLNAADVEGYTDACIGYVRGCTNNTYNCSPRQRCGYEGQAPCFINYFCKIAT
jgi:hypothetical protein